MVISRAPPAVIPRLDLYARHVVQVPAAQPGPEAAPAAVHTRRVIALAAVGALGGFLFGYDSSVINGANRAVFAEFGITDGFLQGFVVSIALLGSAVGAFVGGGIAARQGRRRVMVVAAVLFLIAGIGTGVPFGIWDFMLWRVVGGFAIGLAAVVSPMYISEIAPAHLRGRLSSLFQLAIVIGIFATQLVNEVIIGLAGGNAANPLGPLEAWQWMFLMMVIPATAYGVLAARLPESPRYLVEADRIDDAAAVLRSIYVDDVQPRLQSIRASLADEDRSTLRDLVGPRGGLLPVVWIGIGIAVFQQFVGINAVFYYSNLIWSSVGFSEQDAFLTSTIISLVNVVFTVVAIALVDRIGRRPLLLIGSAGMAVSLATLAVVFATAPKVAGGANAGQPDLGDVSGPLAVVALNVFVAFFAATWGPVAWVLLGEMFPNAIRAAALSVAVMANWIANFVVSESFPELVSISLGLAYGLFTLFAVLSLGYVWRFVRETKGAELEQMGSLEGADGVAAPRG
jgi:SP family sugar:H+ symporter-like MFS transporter